MRALFFPIIIAQVTGFHGALSDPWILDESIPLHPTWDGFKSSFPKLTFVQQKY